MRIDFLSDFYVKGGYCLARRTTVFFHQFDCFMPSCPPPPFIQGGEFLVLRKKQMIPFTNYA